MFVSRGLRHPSAIVAVQRTGLDNKRELNQVKHERLKAGIIQVLNPETHLWYPMEDRPKIEDNQTP